MSPIRLLIVDDHDILRYGVRSLLRAQPGIEVVGEAATVAEALRQAEALRPDVILMDEDMPDGSGIDACREILSAAAGTRVLFFSAYSDEETVMSAMLAGAHGHLRKDLELDGLVGAVQAVAAGGTRFDEALRGRMREAIERRSRSVGLQGGETERLSRQEERVLSLVVEGLTNKQIGERLSLSGKTVKNYLHNAFRKLGVDRRAEAASVFEIARLKRAHGRDD